MKKILFMLALVFASNSYACEWRLTVTDLITNELKYYKSTQELQSILLDNQTSKEQFNCSYNVQEMPIEGNRKGVVKRAETAFVGCSSGDYLNMASANRVEGFDGYTQDGYVNFIVYSLAKNEFNPLYTLNLACD